MIVPIIRLDIKMTNGLVSEQDLCMEKTSQTPVFSGK